MIIASIVNISSDKILHTYLQNRAELISVLYRRWPKWQMAETTGRIGPKRRNVWHLMEIMIFMITNGAPMYLRVLDSRLLLTRTPFDPHIIGLVSGVGGHKRFDTHQRMAIALVQPHLHADLPALAKRLLTGRLYYWSQRHSKIEYSGHGMDSKTGAVDV